MSAVRRLAPADVEIVVDGARVAARAGESVAAALAANGAWPALYCGMGVCHACAVTIDGVAGRRACIVPVEQGMRVARSGWESLVEPAD